MTTLRFGTSAEIEIPDAMCIATYGGGIGSPISDVAQATRDALKSPDGYPDLASMTIPEDRVAIVLEPGLARHAELVAGVVNELISAKIEPDNIAIVQSKIDSAYSKASPISKLPDSIRNHVLRVVHDPSDREMLSYLGASTKEQLIYVNRQIADADVVIPLGVAKHQDLLANLGVFGIVVPHFCDQETIDRFLKPKSSLPEKERDLRRGEAREIAWTLGIRLTIQLVMGDGDCVERVMAGDAEVIEGHGRTVCEENWHLRNTQRTDLVVAAVSGGKSEQTWDNLARAIRAAKQLAEVDGTIAICSELSARPGTALRRIIGADSLEAAAKAIKKEASSDALVASELISALQNGRVYLLSGLDEQLVEDLGIGYISEVEEVSRLVSRHGSCVVVENAQRVVVDCMVKT